MARLPRTAPLVSIIVMLALAACGGDAVSPPPNVAAPSDPPPSAIPGTVASDLSAIACATDDPADVGELTGAWAGDDDGVYYIRQVGDCLWWFGTEVRDIELGATGQRGFSNVAAGRVDGVEVVVEWADVPMGDIVNGGGLTLAYDEAADRLEITERRGVGRAFGGTVFTRIDPDTPPDPSPSASS